jgi:tRNA wybutosine-synthesizing protein 4
VEVDFSEVTRKKAMLIAAEELLLSKLGLEPKISIVEGEIISEHYRLLPADLRDLKDLDRVFLQATLDPKQPTLIIAECVLIYLEPHVSRAVVKWAADKFETAAFVIYEQIHPNDAFGQQMLRNLEVCILLSVFLDLLVCKFI